MTEARAGVRFPAGLVIAVGTVAAVLVPIAILMGGISLRPYTFGGGGDGFLPFQLSSALGVAIVLLGFGVSIAAISRPETRTEGIVLTAVIGTLILIVLPLGLFAAVYGDPGA